MNKFNELLAVKITMAVGTMWAFYLFVLYGLIPIFFPVIQDKVLYWSNFVQLIFLPLLAVGSAVLGKSSEKRNDETHDNVMQELQLAKEERQQLTDLVKVLHEIQTDNASTDDELKYLHSIVLEELTEIRKIMNSQNGGK